MINETNVRNVYLSSSSCNRSLVHVNMDIVRVAHTQNNNTLIVKLLLLSKPKPNK